ncbi:hypothetical protein, partial [Microbacterium sp.]|uniref:hypothetical protein n=1 Tax=Microbacterium sp. TaxID=51671 RepID=UPI0027332A8F
MVCSDVRFAHGQGDGVRGQHIGTYVDEGLLKLLGRGITQCSSMRRVNCSGVGVHGTRSTPLRRCGSAAIASSRSAA